MTKLQAVFAGMVAVFLTGCNYYDPESDLEEEDLEVVEQALCSGVACNGVDPNVTGCDVGASTLATKTFAQGKLELRYSSTCKTKWAKVTRNDGARLSGAWVQTSSGTGKGTTTDWVVWSYMWSNMWYAPSTSMQACAIITTCTGDCDQQGTQYCTVFQ